MTGRIRTKLAQKITEMFSEYGKYDPYFKGLIVHPEDLHTQPPVYRKPIFDIYSWEGIAKRRKESKLSSPISICSDYTMSSLLKSNNLTFDLKTHEISG